MVRRGFDCYNFDYTVNYTVNSPSHRRYDLKEHRTESVVADRGQALVTHPEQLFQ